MGRPSLPRSVAFAKKKKIKKRGKVCVCVYV